MEIIKYKTINKNSLVSSFNLKIPKWGGFIINEIKYFKKGTARWISLPSRQYEDNGEKKYYNLNAFEKPEMMAVTNRRPLQSHVACPFTVVMRAQQG